MLWRGIVSVIAAATLASVASGALNSDVIVVAKPAFFPALQSVTASGPLRLAEVSRATRAPSYTPRRDLPIPDQAPRALSGHEATRAFGQAGTTFVIYGDTLLAAFGPRGGMKYALDLRSFAVPPASITRTAYPQAVVWARQVGSTVVVETAHPGYASDSGGRNGYLTRINTKTGDVLWRSPSLVANAGTFVIVGSSIVSGYGFTAERDWLYLVDLRTGRVRDRLALPSAAEEITRRNDELVVRAYDARVIARLVPA